MWIKVLFCYSSQPNVCSIFLYSKRCNRNICIYKINKKLATIVDWPIQYYILSRQMLSIYETNKQLFFYSLDVSTRILYIICMVWNSTILYGLTDTTLTIIIHAILYNPVSILTRAFIKRWSSHMSNPFSMFS